MPELYVAISGHGFGHLGQVSPVINELCRRMPGLAVTVQTELPREAVASRLDRPFRLVRKSSDIGMRMAGPLRVLQAETVNAYQELHSNWDDTLSKQVELLEQHPFDLLLADVPYLPLAATQALGKPNIAICSLNWADVFRQYCGETATTQAWLETMHEAYANAAHFLQPEPSMPMPDLNNRVAIGPIATLGRNRSEEIKRRLHIADTDRIVLVSLGGIAQELGIHRWPAAPGVTWLADRAGLQESAQARSLVPLHDIPFVDVLASADALITKPGYGIFTEAACNGTPVIYVERGDWPEEPYLCPWLEANAPALKVPAEVLETGQWSEVLEALWSMSAVNPCPEPTGIEQAAELLQPFLELEKAKS